MSLSVKRLQDHVQHALGGRVSSELDLNTIVNEGGTNFMNMRSWNFASRPPLSRDFKNAQSFVLLPNDFGEMIAPPTLSSSFVGEFTMCTLDDIVTLRSIAGYPVTGSYYGAVSWPQTYTTNGAPGGSPVPRLEIFPPPGADSVAALQLQYRAGWKTILGDQEYVGVPDFAVPLLIQVVRATVLGYEEDNQATVFQRLDAIEKSSMFANAAMKDGKTSPQLGQNSGGAAAAQALRIPFTPFYVSRIGP